MPRGGKRPGAGKPLGTKDKTTLKKEAFRARYEAKMAAEWDAIIDAQIDLCKGFVLADQTDDTGNRTYMKSPSAEMNRFVADQMMGKAVQPIAGDTPDGSINLNITGIKYIVPNGDNA